MSGPDLSALQFLRPAWLFALLAIPVVLAWWYWRQRRHGIWQEVVDPHLLPHLIEVERGRRGQDNLWLGLLAWALLACALAGPSWRSVPQPLHTGEAPLVVALELSTATLANDLPPSRLLQARAKLAHLLRERTGGEVGLLVYADDAFTVAPLTDDAGNVALFLDALAPGIMPVDGSRPDRAIDAAARLLQQAQAARGDILLLASDAAPSTAAAAARARDSGYRVSVIGMGTATGAAYRRADGAIARTALDGASLRAVAAAGGGTYSDWARGGTDLAAVGALSARPGGDEAPAGGTVLVPSDGGFWLLPLVMLLALLAFRRGSAFAVVLVCLALPMAPLRAQHAQDTPAGSAFRRADQAAHQRSVEAEAAYRRGEYAAAAHAWQRVPGADAAYNRGNALARAGRYEDALSAYDEALRLRPGMADAIANRAAVAAAMARTPPPGPADGSRGKAEGTPDSGRPEPGEGEPGADGADGAESASEGSPPPPDKASPPDAPARNTGAAPAQDAGRQQEADAAQRDRMQRALEGDAPGDTGDRESGRPVPGDSAAEREKRQANEAWLRRVPDDPGGLLRAKFLLEHERRQRAGADSAP